MSLVEAMAISWLSLLGNECLGEPGKSGVGANASHVKAALMISMHDVMYARVPNGSSAN